MRRRSGFSQQTLAVLAVLCEQPSEWRHGYELAKRTGLKSGTLYPILVRLAERGWLETRWVEPGRPGLPPRHTYRLTGPGCALARSRLADAARPAAGRLTAAEGAG